jgi:HopA1 effector protein family
MISEAKYLELSNIIKSIEIVSPTEFLFHNSGEYLTADGQKHNIRISAEESSAYPIAELHNIFYTVLHCRQDRSVFYRTSNISQYHDIRHLTELLSEANKGVGSWDPGWEIIKIEKIGGQFAVQKNGLTLWAYPKEIFVQAGTVKVGQKAHIKIGKEFRELSPGFYMANGNARSEDSSGIVVRVYWNITAAGAVPLMKNLTTELNAINLPFRFKILKNPYVFSRVDAAVLYINKQHLGNSKSSLSKVHRRIRPYLNHPTPYFAKELVPGLSLAESPRSEESFGEHRCRILAEAVYNTYKKGIRSLDAKVSEIIQYFAGSGIDINHAYLNPNSVDDYDVLLRGEFV